MGEFVKILEASAKLIELQYRELHHIESLIIAHHKTVGVLDTEVDYVMKMFESEMWSFDRAQDSLLHILLIELSL